MNGTGTPVFEEQGTASQHPHAFQEYIDSNSSR